MHLQVAEKTSKFKIDIESSNRHKSAQVGSRKGSREKRPSMISELYTTGSGNRMRGSYGNIHAYHGNRSNFGANRTVSLDQYITVNRRSSDGLQQVTSDNNVYYNQRQHYSLENEVAYGHAHYATISENEKLSKPEDECSSSCDSNNMAFSKNIPTDSKAKQDNQPVQRQSQQGKYTSNKLINSATSATSSSTKSFMSRLRQLTGRFSFSFDRESKRNVTPTKTAIRNNNSNDSAPLAKSAFCCSQKNPSLINTQRKELIMVAAATTVSTTQPSNAMAMTTTATVARNRAYSLDVPIRSRYSSSDDSRKSSRNEDNNHIAGLTFDDNASADNKSDVIDSGSYGNISVGNDRTGPAGGDKLSSDANI